MNLLDDTVYLLYLPVYLLDVFFTERVSSWSTHTEECTVTWLTALITKTCFQWYPEGMYIIHWAHLFPSPPHLSLSLYSFFLNHVRVRKAQLPAEDKVKTAVFSGVRSKLALVRWDGGCVQSVRANFKKTLIFMTCEGETHSITGWVRTVLVELLLCSALAIWRFYL